MIKDIKAPKLVE